MNIWHISDTHTYHNLLIPPDSIETVIHSGDFSNSYDVYKNEQEALNFLHWYGSLKIKNKILIAGNHDAYAFSMKKFFKDWCNHYGITYLENESITIDGINIYGTPITPTFGNWYFQKARHKLHEFWQKSIPDNINVLVTHGPPKGVLDLSYNRSNQLEFCGCNALKVRINQIKPNLVLFGHVHTVADIINAGTRKLSNSPTIFSNGSVVTDGKFGKLTSNGNILKI